MMAPMWTRLMAMALIAGCALGDAAKEVLGESTNAAEKEVGLLPDTSVEVPNESWFWVQVLVYPLGIFMCFVALAIVCDEYLAPALEKLVEAYNIPHDVASATFLALGSSAPEISINCVATAHGNVNMSLGAVLGSGIIAYTVIPAACVLVSKGQVLKLETIPLVRDVAFYSISIISFIFFTSTHTFDVKENSILLGIFVAYLIALSILGKFYHEGNEEQEGNDEAGNQIATEDDPLIRKRSFDTDTIDEIKKDKTVRFHRYKTIGDEPGRSGFIGDVETNPMVFEGQKELEDAENCFVSMIGFVSAPLRLVFRFTIPPFCPVVEESDDIEDDDEPGFEIGKEWPLTMVVSMVYVSVLSEFVLVLTSGFADVVGLPHHIAGLTILALGAQVPDLFASVSVAKKGEGPSSIANAVGSQIINILFGVGFPFLIYNLTQHKPIRIDMTNQEGGQGLILTGVLVFVLVAVFLGLCFRHFHKASHIAALRKPALTSLDAVVLSSLYVAILLILVASDKVSSSKGH